MVIKEQLQSVSFKQKLPKIFILLSHCYGSVEPIYKNLSKYFLDCGELCTNEGISTKNFGK